MKEIIYVFILMAFAFFSCSGVFAADAGDFNENGVFLSHNYVKYQSYVNLVNTLSSNMKNNYKCKYWFVNVGVLNPTGDINNPSVELYRIRQFLNAVKSYETANSCNFVLIAWINAEKSDENLSSSSLRSAIVAECKKFLSTSAPGSYVAGASRTFDGISMDIEPTGNDDTYFNNYKTLMDEIRAAFNSGGLSSKLTSVCAHKYGTTSSTYFWSPVYYYYMALRVNLMVAMTYNSQSSSASAYQTWMGDQTYDILRAVSGKYWGDPSHPAPTNGVKVLIGFPAYPASGVHNPAYENTRYAAIGTLEGLTDLQNDPCDPSEDYFKAGFVYLHSDGSGSDGYASYSTDWLWWTQYWLTPPARTDIIRDDIVNFLDFSEFVKHWHSDSGDPLYNEKYDFNHDDTISMNDLDYIAQDWLTSGGVY